MKFFSNHKDTLSVISIINKKRTRIALFKNGEFETNDPEVIRRLKTKFRFESPKVLSGLAGFLKLKTEAMNKGVYKKGMKKKDIIKALEEYNASKV
ncbi:unnamed protein product [marine sediment metagenome]|uniref:Uncharacterized protein n=1 Tax=marine sediment metagenome TaxID=412755 RepID=X1CBB1_9ZZZZ